MNIFKSENMHNLLECNAEYNYEIINEGCYINVNSNIINLVDGSTHLSALAACLCIIMGVLRASEIINLRLDSIRLIFACIIIVNYSIRILIYSTSTTHFLIIVTIVMLIWKLTTRTIVVVMAGGNYAKCCFKLVTDIELDIHNNSIII